ncbi:hypothetical protein PAHAL_6G081700 [Panicum hallii]|uniref:Uncharacterized protein n=1 Tax=Panicum hallii TaxID=206008 RepID=A0A2S3I198_9POAL|nr:hypothetical protein PAHAL_6G081700 [Panicum hallii]
MASGEPNCMNAEGDAAVSDWESSTAAGASPGRVLPLGVLEFKVPRCKDLDTVECARKTIEWCVTEATARLAVAAADETVRGNRCVITAGDMERAIRGLKEPDTVPGAVLRELVARAKEEKRADKLMRRQERASRKQAGEEGAAAAQEEQGPRGGRTSGHQE